MRAMILKLLFLIVPLFVLSVEVVIAEPIPADIRYLHVQKGQTLHNIVSKLYPSQKKEWPRIRQDIIRLNPSAFVDGKESRMKAGVRLTLPKKRVAKKPTR